MNITKYVNRLQDFDNRWWYTGYHLDFLLLDFEVAPIEYQCYLTKDEAIMYCFSLNIDDKIGWRLPTSEEVNAAGLNYRLCYILNTTWEYSGRCAVRPVRDIGKYSFTRKLLCKILNLAFSKKS